MVTLVAGAVAFGIVSACAIPFGCFISRKLKKKVLIVPEVEEPPPSFNDQGLSLPPESNPAEAENDSEYQIQEVWARPENGRMPRVEIRVWVSNGSTRTTDVPSQGYITGSGTLEEASSSAAIEARRLSLQNFAAGPAADRQNEARSSSLPMDVKMCEYSSRGSSQSTSCDTTRLEITISGAFCKRVAHCQFGEFKNKVPESSTPKSKSSSGEETDMQTSSFWRRASLCSRNGPPKISKTKRGVELINVEVMSGDELRQRSNVEPHFATEAKAEGNCSTRNESRKPELEAKVSSQGNGAAATAAAAAACDRGRWGLPSRFFESFRETTSFVTL